MDTATPLVSIITPAYNAESLLSDTIQSALAQSFTDFEFLIADDGSTDGTLDVARRWAQLDSRVKVLTGPNGGTSSARNRAMHQARGSYFALLDSDDLWQPGYLDAQLAVFRDHPEADVVTGNAYNFGGPYNGRPLKPIGPACHRLSLLDIIEDEGAVCIMSVVRRRVFDGIGAFNTDLRQCEDYEYWVRAVHAGFVLLANPAPLAYYRRHANSISANQIDHYNWVVFMYQSLRSLCQDRPIELVAIERQVARFERERLFITAKTHLVRGEFEAAAAHFTRLSAVTDDLASAIMAGVSRHVPHALLWAYRAKSALRTLRRAPVRT
jgi:teichuronic acid biosynthesis glycosyltransferase TuaG